MRHILAILGAAVGVAAVIALAAILTVTSRQPTVQALPATADATPCPTDWYRSTDQDILTRCYAEKQARYNEAMKQAMTQAPLNPTVIPLSATRHDQLATTRLSPAPTPEIYALDPNTTADGPPVLRGTNSIWHIGTIPTHEEGMPGTLYLLARPPRDGEHARLLLLVEGDFVNEEQEQTYNKGWKAPEDVGTMTITGITDLTISATAPTGLVSFTTSSGKTGTFDIATETWTFNE
jgi:hypothetical protein